MTREMALIGLLLARNGVVAREAHAVRATVESELGGIDTLPRELRSRDPFTAIALRDIAADRTKPLSLRARAVSRLRQFPSRETQRYLERLLSDHRTPSLLRRKAALVLGGVPQFRTEADDDASRREDEFADGRNQGHPPGRTLVDGAFEALQKEVDSADLRLRDDVVRALGSMQSGRARDLLVERLRIEETFVRRTLQKVLKTLDEQDSKRRP